MTIHAIILAAGKGTRMKSDKVKIIHEVAGQAVINKVIQNLEEVNVLSICIVVGFQSEEVKNIITAKNVEFVIQQEQLGTGHAVIQTSPLFTDKTGDIVILAGDAPLISGKTLNELYQFHQNNRAALTVLTTAMPDPTGYGRIVRDKRGQVLKIVEHKDATENEKIISEVNTGVYCVDKQILFDCLKHISNDNRQREYYLTDIVKIAKDKDLNVFAFMANNHKEFQGINSRIDLADVTRYILDRKNKDLMESGVTFIDPKNTYIEQHVTIDQDSIIYPGVYIKGKSTIGKHCIIGPNAYLENVTIEDNTVIKPGQILIMNN